MYNTNHLIKSALFIVLGLTLLTSCSSPKTQLSPKAPADFEVAMRAMANDLLETALNHKELLESQGKITVALELFVDAKSGEVVKNLSRRIEQIILKESQTNFDDFAIRSSTPQNPRNAQYTISGVIDFNLPKKPGYHQVSVLMSSLKTGKVLADSSGFISQPDFNYAPTSKRQNSPRHLTDKLPTPKPQDSPMHLTDNLPAPKYQDSPMYLSDKRFESIKTIAASIIGKLPNKERYDALNTDALLKEAETLYDKQDYDQSFLLYYLAQERPDGQLVKTYAGLYQTTRQLKHQAAAEEAFDKLLGASLKENNRLNLKFLFSVNSTDFINDDELKDEYSFWLRQIAKHFQNNNRCFHIVGHSSTAENQDYDQQLSLSRAKTIQQLMGAHFPKITQSLKVIGKGFSENLVGTGTNDARDAVDRRVEIVVVDCSQI